MSHFSFIQVVAGLGFFLYGLRLTETNLRQAAGDKLRKWISKLTQNRIQAVLLGFIMTIVFQSSTATTVMIIGLAGIGYLQLRQAIAVVLGADVGTAILVFVLASFVRYHSTTLYSSSDIALVFLVVAFLLNFILRSGRSYFIAQAVLGFSLLLYGLNLVIQTSIPLRESVLVGQVITAISSNAGAAIFLAALLTALVQSSAAVIGIVLSFAGVGVLSIEQALPFVMGANLGSTVVPFLVGKNALADGRRLAYIHVATKVLGILLVFPFIGTIATLLPFLSEFPAYEVASFHILFNVMLVVLGLPFIDYTAKWFTNWVREGDNSKKFGPKYLDPQALNSPTLAFANVFREILHMAEIAQEMVSQVILPFQEAGTDTLHRLEELDDEIDLLDRDIKFYLAKISQTQFTEEQSKRQVELLMLTHDLEQVGDVITKDLLELAKKKRRKSVAFSQEGWNEIRDFHRKVVENFHLAVTSFASNDMELGRIVIRHKKRLAEIEEELAQKHLMRLHQGSKESFDTSSIHLDLLSNLRRINAIVSKLAYPVLDRRQTERP